MLAKTIQQNLDQAGLAINGPQPYDIQVHDKRWFRRVLVEKNLGLGESYMDGWWDCEQIDETIYRLLLGGLGDQVRGGLRYLLHFIPGLIFNLQSRARSRIIAERHYDLDNELFLSFLDANHQYSCAYFDKTDDLEEAQRKKLDLIARKLHISQNDHLLDIGCGWGGLSRYFAENHGCKVTAVNISREQLEHARKICAELPVSLHDRDYREIYDVFDKIVSVGMFEHVGNRNYRTFMEVAHRSLKEDGIFLLHTIGSNTSSSNCDPWINKYIFPNGMLPSQKHIAKAIEDLFVIEDVHNLGPHYDKTLLAWNHNFQKAWPRLSEKYDSRFKRMWEYYLLSCAGAFRARNIQVWQILMTRSDSGMPTPFCRF